MTDLSKSFVYLGAGDARSGKGTLVRKKPGEDGWEIVTNGLPENPDVRAIAVHPLHPNVVYVGTQKGLFVSRDNGDAWSSLNTPTVQNEVVFSISFDPHNYDIIYVGTAPARMLVSRDGGVSWTDLNLEVGPDKCELFFPTRVISIGIDPNNTDYIYAGLEVAGMTRSLDGGNSWQCINNGLREGGEDQLDIHGVQLSSSEAGIVRISTREGMYKSDNRGDSWSFIDISASSDIGYTRCLQVSPSDADTIYVSVGAGAVSDKGGLLRTKNLGEAWENLDLISDVSSTVMSIAFSKSDNNEIWCTSRNAQLFYSLDGGDQWSPQAFPLDLLKEGYTGQRECYAIAAS